MIGKKVSDPLKHTNAESGVEILSPRSSLYLPVGGSRASGLGTPLEDPILAKAGSMGLSQSSSVWEGLKEDGPSPSIRGVSTSMLIGPSLLIQRDGRA